MKSFRLARFALVSRLFTDLGAIAWLAVAALFFGLCALPWARGPHAGPWIVTGLSTLLVATSLATRTKLTIGADGVYARELFRRRFIPYADVASVSTYQIGVLGKRHVGVVLSMRDGTKRRLLVGRAAFDGGRAVRIAERIRDALYSARRAEPTTAIAALERGGRELRDWIGALRSIGAGANADLRTADVPPETLWRIVEDPRAPPPARASAAVALGAQLDEASRARLRATAERTAAPRLRIALDAAVDGADESIAAALEELEDEVASTRR